MLINNFFNQVESSDKVPELTLKFQNSIYSKQRLRTAEERATFLIELFDKDTFDIREEMILLILNSNDMPVCFYRLSKGDAGSVPIPFTTLFAALLSLHASRFILAHNHPGEDALPSYSDIHIAHELGLRAQMFDIEVTDFIIISGLHNTEEEEDDFPKYYSLRENDHFYE